MHKCLFTKIYFRKIEVSNENELEGKIFNFYEIYLPVYFTRINTLLYFIRRVWGTLQR